MTNRLVVKSDEERLVYAEVYSPLHIDTDGEAMTAESIRKMAHRFLSSGRVHKIDVQHNQQESGCEVVESFIVRKQDPDGFIDGSWVLGIHVIPDELWERVKKGELNGLSFFGAVQKVPARASVIVTRKMVGDTEDSLDAGPLPSHSHPVTIDFSENGRVLEGYTECVLDHRHRVQKATATELEWDHAHRLILIDNEMFKTASKGGAGSGSWDGPGQPRFDADAASSGEKRFSDREEWEKSLTPDQRNAVNSWMFSGYEGIRDADKGNPTDSSYKEKLGQLKAALATAPLYTSDIHRGIRADVKCSVGDKMKMSALSSFSTNRAIARTFSVQKPEGGLTSPKQKFTVLSITSHKGAPTLPMKAVGGTYETEVVVEKTRSFRVTKIEKMEIKRPGGKVWHGKQVFLEED